MESVVDPKYWELDDDERCTVWGCVRRPVFEVTNAGFNVARFCSLTHMTIWARSEEARLLLSEDVW